ncbi:MAG: rod shape-determining protein MreC [Ruminococcaceae bacterium]|nr:rod shape-determining protein MreC [Oscillospiraceae bacterium]
MREYFKSKFFFIITVIALLVTIVPTVYAHMGVTFVLRDAVNVILTPMQKVFNTAADAVDGFTGYFHRFDELVEENAALREEVNRLQEQVYDNRELEQMYAWMSEFLEMKIQHTDFQFTKATITGRDSGSYSSILTLDVGSGAGIEVGMPVVSAQGLIGQISEVGHNWSRVTTLAEAQSAAGAYVERSNAAGIAEGNLALAKDGQCRLNYLAADADVQVGDRILTSGYGVYPRGLVIGYVEAVEVNPYDRTQYAVVGLSVPLAELNNVMIITSSDLYAE